jgi:Domain of unknown function (DUF3291)
MNSQFHLAQANIARMRAPRENPMMKSFVDQLDYINSVADRAPGFVWRLQDEAGDATAIRVFEDERILFNMSVWESVEALFDYVYKSDHKAPLRDRRNWFEKVEGATVVLWWIPAGTLPTVDEARARFEQLNRDGPTPSAFTFKTLFAPDGSVVRRAVVDRA